MRTGTQLSAIGHGALILLAFFGLPQFAPRERAPIRITAVTFVSETEFEAAQTPSPEPEPNAEAPDEPLLEVPVLEPPAGIETPEAQDRIPPKVATMEPPTAAVPPVKSEPTPSVKAFPPANLPQSAAPRAREVARAEEEPKETRTAALPLQTSTVLRPRPRSRPPDTGAESLMAALKRQVAEEVARRQGEPQSTRAIEPTPATAAPAATAPTPAGAALPPAGAPLGKSEKDALKFAVQRCWNVPAGVRDAHDLKVTLAAELAADGAVINGSIRMIEPRAAPDGRFRQAFEAGRRALIRCSPYDLPREKFGQWRKIEVVFNPEGMVSW